MKILHWDEMFHPNFGYQINVLPKYQSKQGHEVIIMTSENIEKHPTFAEFANAVDIKVEDQKFTEKYGIKIVRLPIHGVISGRVIYRGNYLARIIQEKPDVLFCHTNDTLSGIYITLNFRKLNLPVVFDNHMLEMASNNPFRSIFRIFFKSVVVPIIKKHNLKVIRTQNDDYINKILGVPKELTPYISFGSDTLLFKPDEMRKNKLRVLYGIENKEFVVIYAGKLTEAKGLRILTDVIKSKLSNERDITFLIVGNARNGVEKETLEFIKHSENKVIHFPTQRYEDLPNFYNIADLCIFPKQCSLSFYDAQACGLPVIAEDNNVNIDRLNHGNGFVFRTNDAYDLRTKIRDCAEMNMSEYHKIAENAHNFVFNHFNYENIANEYTKILLEEYQRFHGIGSYL